MILQMDTWFRFRWFCNWLWHWLTMPFLQTMYVLVLQFSQWDIALKMINYKYLVILLLPKKLCKCESYLNLPIVFSLSVFVLRAQRQWVGEGQTSETGSTLTAESLMRGFNSQAARSGPELVRHSTDWALQAPLKFTSSFPLSFDIQRKTSKTIAWRLQVQINIPDVAFEMKVKLH